MLHLVLFVHNLSSIISDWASRRQFDNHTLARFFRRNHRFHFSVPFLPLSRTTLLASSQERVDGSTPRSRLRLHP